MKIVFITLLMVVPFFNHGQSLKPGAKAPPLSAYKWLKGKSIDEFQPGKIYVIEFGATWCGPCSAAIPELSALAIKYKKNVEVISFFVMEQMSRGQGRYGENVERFVKKRWDQMNYTVALDDVNGTMQKNWLVNAGQSGIPFTVVIDQHGTIAWAGNNIKTLEAVIQTAGGKW